MTTTNGKKKQDRLDSKKVAVFAAKKGVFSTDDVADKFHVPRQQASAAIAILRIKEVVDHGDPDVAADGSSQWRWVG